MKRILSLALILTLVMSLFMFVGCGAEKDPATPDTEPTEPTEPAVVEPVILANEGKDYFVTGNFANWGDAVGKDECKMEAVALEDERIAAFAADLAGAKYVYVKEGIVLSADDAGWTAKIVADGAVAEVNGNLTLKILQVAEGGEAPDWWGQSPESGEIRSLTPDLLFIPEFVETPELEGAPGWNDNPAALTAGTYTVVFANMGDYKVMGLIAE